jgi:hypothetical protein
VKNRKQPSNHEFFRRTPSANAAAQAASEGPALL